MKKRLLIIALVVFCISSVHAQWSDDYSKNNQITPASLAFDEHETVTNKDGVTYVFLMVPNNNKYSMRLQIIDKDGNRLFGGGGKEISNENNITWTKVNKYIMVDHDGNAIISVQDSRLDPTCEKESYTIYKYDAEGNQLWQTVLGDSATYIMQACMTMCCSDDGGYVFAYEYGLDDKYTQVEKLDANGKEVWEKPIMIKDELTDPENGGFPYPYLTDAGNNQSMLIYANSDNVDLKARLINGDGTSAWKEDITAYSGGYSSAKIWQVINTYPGPDGGAVISIMNQDLYGIIDYVKNNGELGFDTGSTGSTVNVNDYCSLKPAVYYSKEDNAIFCVYQQFNADNQANQGLFMQKFSLTGERLWGNDGKPIVDMQEGKQYSYYSIQNAGEGHFAVLYQERDNETTFVNSYLTVFDKDGNTVESPKSFSTSQYQKEQLASSQLVDGKYFIANWCEKRSGNNLSIYMQKVNLDTPVSGINHTDASQKTLRQKGNILTFRCSHTENGTRNKHHPQDLF